jgi:hypothetical protein
MGKDLRHLPGVSVVRHLPHFRFYQRTISGDGLLGLVAVQVVIVSQDSAHSVPVFFDQGLRQHDLISHKLATYRSCAVREYV